MDRSGPRRHAGPRDRVRPPGRGAARGGAVPPERYPGRGHRRRRRSPPLADPARLGRAPCPPARPPRRGIRRSRAGAGGRGGLRRGRRDPHAGDGAAHQGDPPRPAPRRPTGQPVGGPGARTGLGTRQRAGRGVAGGAGLRRGLPAPASHAIELAGIDFAVVKLAVEATEHTHDTFRGHFGHLAPVAIMPFGDAPMELCPGRDHPLHAGDRVAVLGTVDELQRMGITTTRPRTARRGRSGWPAASGCRSASRSKRATAPWRSWPRRCSP